MRTFCALSERADVLYKCTEVRYADDEYGLLWNDPDLAIAWPVEDPVLSDKDATNPTLREYLNVPMP